MSVTIHDIARIAGVNASTVSRALRGDARVKAETVRRIREIAERHCYVPNRNARCLISGRTGTVWLVLSSLESHLEREIATELAAVMRRHGYELLIALADRFTDHFAAIVERLRQRTADGAILIASGGPAAPACFKAPEHFPVPTVCLDRWFDNTPTVTNDNPAAVKALLIDCIAAGADGFWLAASAANAVSHERMSAAKQFLDDQKIPWVTTMDEFARRQFAAPGILADSEHEILVALEEKQLLTALAGRLYSGYFDTVDPLMRSIYAHRTVCIQDFAGMAAAAAEMLLARIQDRSVPYEFRRIPYLEVKEA